MKTIAIILVILAFVNSEKIRTSLRLNRGPSNGRGIVNFEQDDPGSPIEITGNITNLGLGKYFAFVLEDKNDTNDNNCLGSIIDKKKGGILFLVFTVEVKSERHQNFSLPIVKFTLSPGETDSISGRAVALYDSKKMRLESRQTKKREDILACGVVDETAVVPETPKRHNDTDRKFNLLPCHPM